MYSLNLLGIVFNTLQYHLQMSGKKSLCHFLGMYQYQMFISDTFSDTTFSISADTEYQSDIADEAIFFRVEYFENCVSLTLTTDTDPHPPILTLPFLLRYCRYPVSVHPYHYHESAIFPLN